MAMLTPLHRETKTTTLGEALENGVAFADNSWSTDGSVIISTGRLIKELGCGKTALWSCECGSILPTEDVSFRARGGTRPSSIYRCHDVDALCSSWSSFVLTTDGGVSSTEIEEVAAYSHLTSHLPSIFVVVCDNFNGATPLQNVNVSVHFAHMTSATNALLLLVECQSGHTIRVLQAKGCFADTFPRLPNLEDATMTDEFPVVATDKLRSLRCTTEEPIPANAIAVSNGTELLNLDAMLLSTNVDGLVHLQPGDLDNIVRRMDTQRRLADLRLWATRQLSQCQRAMAETKAAYTTSDVAAIRRLLQTDAPQTDALEERATLLNVLCSSAPKKEATPDPSQRRVRFLNTVMQAMHAFESMKSSMGAAILGGLSNRSRRATAARDPAPMAGLDLEGAPGEECDIMLNTGPCALMLRRIPPDLLEQNTVDFAIDFPLCLGDAAQNTNRFCPDVIGINDGIADRIDAACVSALTREDTCVCLPIVPLTKKNKEELFVRLCHAFFRGRKMASVWQLTLATIMHTMKTALWAAPETRIGKLLTFFAKEIMDKVTLSATARLAQNQQQTIRAALVASLQTTDLQQHYPLSGVVTAIELLNLYGDAGYKEKSRICLENRLVCLVPQYYAAFTREKRVHASRSPVGSIYWTPHRMLRAIFRTRHTSQAHDMFVPIAGTQRLVDTLEDVFSGNDVDTLKRLPADLRVTLPNANLSLAIKYTLECVPPGNTSSQNAIACMSNGMGVCRRDPPGVLEAIARPLQWAAGKPSTLPPFATRFGPSSIFFYPISSGGDIVNMSKDFVWDNEKPREQNITDLARHIHDRRIVLLHEEFNASPDGGFLAKSTHVPLHKHMSLEYLQRHGEIPDVDEFVTSVTQRILQGACGNIYSPRLEDEIRVLLPSLVAAAEGHLQDPMPERVTLELKLRDELAERLPSELTPTNVVSTGLVI